MPKRQLGLSRMLDMYSEDVRNQRDKRMHVLVAEVD